MAGGLPGDEPRPRSARPPGRRRPPSTPARGDPGRRRDTLIQQVLGNLCRNRNVEAPIAVVVTRVRVDPDDPALPPADQPRGAASLGRGRRAGSPASAAGPSPGAPPADAGGVVPSPRPGRILEADAIRRLADAGVVVIAAGGGGVPVVETPLGHRGVEAVLQEDATAALLGDGGRGRPPGLRHRRRPRGGGAPHALHRDRAALGRGRAGAPGRGRVPARRRWAPRSRRRSRSRRRPAARRSSRRSRAFARRPLDGARRAPGGVPRTTARAG